MISKQLKWITALKKGLLLLPLFVFLVVMFQFNVEVRANQITLFVESGNVEIKNNRKGTFQEVATKYLTLPKNAVVRTNEGSAFLLLPGKSLISMDRFSSLEIRHERHNEFSINSPYGTTWHTLKENLSDRTFKYKLITPNAKLASTGTEFQLDIQDSETLVSQVTLIEGEAVVANTSSQAMETVVGGKTAKVQYDSVEVEIQDLTDEVKESEFFRKNKNVKEKINNIDSSATLDDYQQVIERAGTEIKNSSSSSNDQSASSTPANGNRYSGSTTTPSPNSIKASTSLNNDNNTTGNASQSPTSGSNGTGASGGSSSPEPVNPAGNTVPSPNSNAQATPDPNENANQSPEQPGNNGNNKGGSGNTNPTQNQADQGSDQSVDRADTHDSDCSEDTTIANCEDSDNESIQKQIIDENLESDHRKDTQSIVPNNPKPQPHQSNIATRMR